MIADLCLLLASRGAMGQGYVSPVVGNVVIIEVSSRWPIVISPFQPTVVRGFSK